MGGDSLAPPASSMAIGEVGAAARADEELAACEGQAAAPPGELEHKDKGEEPPSNGVRKVILCSISCLFCLWVFLLGLELLGDAFKCLGGKGVGKLFGSVKDPISGLMVGILGTVLVQSSSTSTSIVVGLVGAQQLTVHNAIPMIMGANVGTSITNTLVSMGQAGDRLMLQRAFSGATVHDMFNILSVAILLPTESITASIQGEGGPIFWITKKITDGLMGGVKGDDPLHGASPIKALTGPIAELLIVNDKAVIHATSLGAPIVHQVTSVNGTLCARLEDCSSYYCVSDEMDALFEKIATSAYEDDLVPCGGSIAEAEFGQHCGRDDTCYTNAGQFYTKHIQSAPVIDGGLFHNFGEVAGGLSALAFALTCLIGGLFGLCKFLHVLFMGRAKSVIVKATSLNDYAAMLVGVVVTIIVQSSSVVTSALTPFCGLGLLSLEKMLPLSLGANIGTTVTALLASLATFTPGAIQVAFCHLFFNVFGILIWFPLPFMRRVVLGAAALLGLYASFFRWVVPGYIFVTFIVAPSLALGVSKLFQGNVAAGVVVTILLALALGAFEFWWWRLGGSYKAISKEDRAERCAEMADSDRKIRGTSGHDIAPATTECSTGEVHELSTPSIDEAAIAADTNISVSAREDEGCCV